MKPGDRESKLQTPSSSWRTWWALVGLGFLTFAAYRNCWDVPLILDDVLAVTENASIRDLSSWSSVLQPPHDSPLGGRPVANLSFALNYAWGGAAVVGYHAVNLALHFAAGWVLLALVRRTVEKIFPTTGATKTPAKGEDAWFLGVVVAGLWLVHPLTTGSVTYVSQRTEVLMALFYLLTLWFFVLGAERRSWKYLGLSTVCCALGMASKEVMVTAPLVVLLYDRTFVAGSWREAWRARKVYYGTLALTWVELAWLLKGISHRSVGFEQGVSAATYALTQCGAVWRYLGLCFWPNPLIFDYGPVFLTLGEAVPFAIGLLLLSVGVIWALRFRPVGGFAGAVFLILLAPTSSIVPVALQPIAENRVYLPLALVVSATVVGVWSWFGRKCLPAFAVLGALAVWQTAVRNETYRQPQDLWQDTVTKRPQNPRAHNNLGQLHSVAGRRAQAIGHFREAQRLSPGYMEAKVNMGWALLEEGKVDEALAAQEAAVREHPLYAPAHFMRASALARAGREPEAVVELEAALRLQPLYHDAHQNLIAMLDRTGNPVRALAVCEQALALWPNDRGFRSARDILLVRQGTPREALARLEAVLRADPTSAEAHHSMGSLLVKVGRYPEAAAHFADAVRLDPAHAAAHADLAGEMLREGRIEAALASARTALRLDPRLVAAHVFAASACLGGGRNGEALEASEAALRLDANNADAHHLRGAALVSLARPAEALAEFERVLVLRPDRAGAHNSIGGALYHLGRYADAIIHYEAAVKSEPNDIGARQNLAGVCYQLGRSEEALEHYREVLRRKPDYLEARKNLANVLAKLGRMVEAETEFRSVLRQAPEDPQARDFFRQMSGQPLPAAVPRP